LSYGAAPNSTLSFISFLNQFLAETLCLVVNARHDFFYSLSNGLILLKPNWVYCILHLLLTSVHLGHESSLKDLEFIITILYSRDEWSRLGFHFVLQVSLAGSSVSRYRYKL
jgi:hypothetical protein